MHLKDPTLAPPGGYTYTQPDSGLTLSGITFGTLLKQVAQHRANMGYATEGRVAEEIEDAICQRLSFEDQTAHCDNGFRPPKAVHWHEVRNFLKTAVSWVKSGSLVPQQEANRRAAICVTCPYNVPLTGCAVCATTLNALREALLQRSTLSDAGLQACGICGCDNKTQVHVPIDALAAGTGHFKYPEWCWKAVASSIDVPPG